MNKMNISPNIRRMSTATARSNTHRKSIMDTSFRDSESVIVEHIKKKKELELMKSESEYSYFDLEDDEKSPQLKESMEESQENSENPENGGSVNHSPTKTGNGSAEFSKKLSLTSSDLDKKEPSNDNFEAIKEILKRTGSREYSPGRKASDETQGKKMEKRAALENSKQNLTNSGKNAIKTNRSSLKMKAPPILAKPKKTITYEEPEQQTSQAFGRDLKRENILKDMAKLELTFDSLKAGNQPEEEIFNVSPKNNQGSSPKNTQGDKNFKKFTFFFIFFFFSKKVFSTRKKYSSNAKIRNIK